MKTCSFVVKRADHEPSALRSEFHCVVDQVPKHLLKPDAISQDVILFRLKFSRDLQLLCCDSRACGLERVFNDRMQFAILQFEMKHAASDSGEVQQVVNQSCLQLHVTFDNLNILAQLCRK